MGHSLKPFKPWNNQRQQLTVQVIINSVSDKARQVQTAVAIGWRTGLVFAGAMVVAKFISCKQGFQMSVFGPNNAREHTQLRNEIHFFAFSRFAIDCDSEEFRSKGMEVLDEMGDGQDECLFIDAAQPTLQRLDAAVCDVRLMGCRGW